MRADILLGALDAGAHGVRVSPRQMARYEII